MPLGLPDPPATLSGPARAFYDELLEMLAAVAPTRVDASKTSVRFDDGGVEIELTHAERDDWSIWATVGDRDAIAGEERPWTTQIVDFIAEILRGENGERNLLGQTGFLLPGRLLIWKPKRTETERASFS